MEKQAKDDCFSSVLKFMKLVNVSLKDELSFFQFIVIRKMMEISELFYNFQLFDQASR